MERRNFIRLNVGVSVRYRILESLGSPKDSKTEDISAGGIRITLSEYVEPETRLELSIRVPTQSEPIVAIGRVIWVRPEPIDKQFISYLDSEHLAGFSAGIQLTYIKKRDKRHLYQYALF